MGGADVGAFDNLRQPLSQAQLQSTATALRAAVAAATATVTSRDGSVTVTAGPGQSILELRINPRAHRDAEVLGELVVATVKRAIGEVNDALAAQVRELTEGRVELPDLLGGALPEQPSTAGAADSPAATAYGESLRSAGGDESVRSAGGDESVRSAGGDESVWPADGEDVVGRLAAEADRQLAGYAALRSALAELVATASDPDGGIVAQVRAGGELLTLHLAPEYLRGDSATLGPLVLATIHRASAQAAKLMAERVQQFTGPRLDLAALVAEHVSAERPDQPRR